MSITVDINKSFGSFQLEIAFSSEQKRIGILGASGSGKSMTLKSVAGIEKPDRGKIFLNDRVLFDSENKINVKPQLRNVGYLFQNYALFPTMSVFDNIASGLKGYSREDSRKRVAEMVDKFKLSGLEKRLPAQLSGGQQQRVALARIMAYQPDVILLDEPFSALDVYLKDKMQEELIELLEDYDGTVIMVSHSRDEVYRFSEELLVVDHGRIDTHGKTKEVFANPETKVTAMLTGCKNFSKAEKIDAHHVKAIDWGVTFETEQELPEEFSHIGFRAHQFVPIYGERQKNCISFRVSSVAELPFEKNFYIKPETDELSKSDLISWFVQREDLKELNERGLPDYLQFPEKDLMFLR